MTTTVIVQARMGSKRLPGKVLLPLAGVPILERVCTALRQSRLADRVVLATSTGTDDDPVARCAEALGVEVVRGSAGDVLQRFVDVLDAYPDTATVVRVTADCPFVDPALVDEIISARERSGADFAANRLPPPYPRTYPIGLDVEACTAAALRTASDEAVQRHQREHVMPYLYEHPERFQIEVLDLDEPLGGLRWTVDTPDDYRAAQQIAALVGPLPVPWRRVLEAVGENPEISSINQTSTQRPVDHHE